LKAEQFIARGQRIRILGESDFLRLIAWPQNQPVSQSSS